MNIAYHTKTNNQTKSQCLIYWVALEAQRLHFNMAWGCYRQELYLLFVMDTFVYLEIFTE